MNTPTPTGVLLDMRDDYEKGKDFLHEEVAMGFEPYVWEERPAKASYYYPYNQSSSLSCVAGGGAITLEKFDGTVPSRKDIYVRRINYPSGGMVLTDLFKIICSGVADEGLVVSQGLGETAMNTRYPVTDEMVKSRTRNKAGTYITIKNCSDIDTIASVSKHVPVVAFWYFDVNGEEWWKPYPGVKFNFQSHVAPGVTRHQVAIVDAILIDGKKYLVGQDTAGIGSGVGTYSNIRYISEEMVSKRLYAAGYAIDDDMLPPPVIAPVRPKYANSQPLRAGMSGPIVMALQSVLIHEGLLKIARPTGIFGGLTRKAVIALQEKYRAEILTPAGLSSGTGYVGTLTNRFLNKKYA